MAAKPPPGPTPPPPGQTPAQPPPVTPATPVASVVAATTASAASVALASTSPAPAAPSAAAATAASSAPPPAAAAAAAPAAAAVLDIGELAGTIESERHRADFRKFLRNLDKTASAAPEVKGRFERYLDFVISLRQLYGLPQSATAAEKRAILAAINAKYFTCPAKERLAVTSQVALKSMADHLADLDKSPAATPNAEVTRPVYEDAYRKLQMKHDVWKKNYKPEMSLNALLCLLS